MGEDGTVQGLLELANIPYVGSGVLGSALAMDKAMAKQVLAANGIAQARYRAFRAHEITPGLPATLAEELGLPLFVKPANMGSSVGVSKAKTVEAVRDAIDVRVDLRRMGRRRGSDRRSGDRGGRARQPRTAGQPSRARSCPAPSSTTTPTSTSTTDRKRLVPAPLTAEQTDEVRAMALQVFKVLRCEGLARVDFFFEEHGRGFLCNEVNTMPGFTPISMYPKMWIASGLSYPELIDELVGLAIERHGRQRRNTAH